MIAIAKGPQPAQVSYQDMHERFLGMLPPIRMLAWQACRGWHRDARHEFVAEVIANAYCAFVQLVRRGRIELAYATPLAKFAIRQVRAGRRVGGKLNVADVTSEYCQLAKGVRIQPLAKRGAMAGEWREILAEDKRSTPAELAATRIDFRAWLRSLGRVQRRIATTLARGESTRDTARKFGLSPARISQLRNELRFAWQRFQGEPALV